VTERQRIDRGSRSTGQNVAATAAAAAVAAASVAATSSEAVQEPQRATEPTTDAHVRRLPQVMSGVTA